MITGSIVGSVEHMAMYLVDTVKDPYAAAPVLPSVVGGSHQRAPLDNGGAVSGNRCHGSQKLTKKDDED